MRITIIWLFLGLFSSEALACSCARWAFEDKVFKADSIYIGIVTKAEIVNPKKGNKRERVNHRRYQTRTEARADVFDYIERFHNPHRRSRLEVNIQKDLSLTNLSGETG